MSDAVLQDRCSRLVELYPRTFAALANFLEAPTLHGEFLLKRRGDDELTYLVTRGHKEAAGRRGRMDDGPMKVL